MKRWRATYGAFGIGCALGLAAWAATSSTDGDSKPSPGTVPIGTILAFAGPAATVPEEGGWLLCDGRELRQAEYGALFQVLGGAWGLDAEAGTFRLPDLRGRFVRGANGGAGGMGRDPDAASRVPSGPGGAGGEEVGSYQADGVGPHVHEVVGVGNASGPGGDGGWIRFYAGKVPDEDAPVVRNGAVVVPNEARETRPVNVAVGWIIRAR